MPLYVNGSPAGAGNVRLVDVGEKIAAAIRENGGRVGDLSKYTEEEMVFVRSAMKELAAEAISRFIDKDWLSGVDIWKVVDECETFPGGDGP